MEGQGVGAASGCLRRRARLAEMRLEMGQLDAAEVLLRKILEYVETAQVGGCLGRADGCLPPLHGCSASPA